MREQHAVNAELKSSELLSAYGRFRPVRCWVRFADRERRNVVESGMAAYGAASRNPDVPILACFITRKKRQRALLHRPN
jgi:hypothetical protein